MLKRVILPLLFGFVGVAILVSLGVWQIQRLAWKEGVLADIEARISDAPVVLPEAPDESVDKYLPVALDGRFGDGVLRVLVSRKQVGAGYRIIAPFETEEGRVVLVDRGFIRVAAQLQPPPTGLVTIEGNVHWPDDRLSSTPENDVAGNTWFARDIGPMSEVLGTEPILIVLREMSGNDPSVTPLPVDTSAIPNDHLEYAITWFSLAVIWTAMTGLFLWRGRGHGRSASAKGTTT